MQVFAIFKKVLSYLKINDVLTALTDLEYTVVPGSTLAENVVRLQIPSGSTELLYSYSNASDYQPRYGYIESVYWQNKRETDASIAAITTELTSTTEKATNAANGILGVYMLKGGWTYGKLGISSVCPNVGDTAWIVVENISNKSFGLGYYVYTNLVSPPKQWLVIDKALNTILPNQSQVIQFSRLRDDVNYLYFDTTDADVEFRVTIYNKNPYLFESLNPLTIPNLGSGQLIMSRDYDTYAHMPYVFNLEKKILIIAQTSSLVTKEQGSDKFDVTLIEIDKIRKNNLVIIKNLQLVFKV